MPMMPLMALLFGCLWIWCGYVAACRLMGVEAIVTGISGAVAEALVTLGIDVSPFNAVGDLQRGIEAAEQLLGYRMVRANGAALALTRAAPAP